MKIVADHKIPFLKGALEDYANVVYLPGNAISQSDLLDADALIIRTRTRCNAGLLDGTKVKFIATATIGYDHIDVDYCKKNGIEWTNAPGCNSSSVEQYLISALVSLAEKKKLKLKELKLGVVGVGNVGKKVARAAEVLGIKVLLNDPPRERQEGKAGFSSLEDLRSQADILSFHVPLNKDGVDKTFHLADERFLVKMKKNSILINTSRGEVVDNLALKKALKNKVLSGAILDVWEGEPNIDLELLSLLDFSTPHIAGYSTDGKANGTMMSVQAISRFFKLGIDHWKPDSVPFALNQDLKIDCANKSESEIIREIYLNCYDISVDDGALRKNPSEFENLRGAYRTRREANSYSVQLVNNQFKKLENTLNNLGFKL
ncbi:MAG: 4-phosphoerythronate dehydrogenase PdxB [Bacteroidales bacterium]|nr:4-phosphoerythronate dehydrogenase PdxB [Bacteroidales bacterium]MCF8391809.1 4-phosphoerythronate dehydrogenase PdxB [Bacteroidales bacterium]